MGMKKAPAFHDRGTGGGLPGGDFHPGPFYPSMLEATSAKARIRSLRFDPSLRSVWNCVQTRGFPDRQADEIDVSFDW